MIKLYTLSGRKTPNSLIKFAKVQIEIIWTNL